MTGAPTFLASYRAGRGERARERRARCCTNGRRLVALSCDVRPGESGSPDPGRATGASWGWSAIVSASTRTKRTETALAARAARLVGALKAVMGGF